MQGEKGLWGDRIFFLLLLIERARDLLDWRFWSSSLVLLVFGKELFCHYQISFYQAHEISYFPYCFNSKWISCTSTCNSSIPWIVLWHPLPFPPIVAFWSTCSRAWTLKIGKMQQMPYLLVLASKISLHAIPIFSHFFHTAMKNNFSSSNTTFLLTGTLPPF